MQDLSTVVGANPLAFSQKEIKISNHSNMQDETSKGLMKSIAKLEMILMQLGENLTASICQLPGRLW